MIHQLRYEPIPRSDLRHLTGMVEGIVIYVQTDDPQS
jgi:hypothetical protein